VALPIAGVKAVAALNMPVVRITLFDSFPEFFGRFGMQAVFTDPATLGFSGVLELKTSSLLLV